LVKIMEIEKETTIFSNINHKIIKKEKLKS
jgi:hypothetical protein